MEKFDEILSLSKQRGFFFESSEIYDCICGVYDYGPLGVELINKLKNSWWKEMVNKNRNIVGLDSAILMNPKVWKYSGHTENFTDPYFECCGCRYRADQFLEDETGKNYEGMEISELEEIINEKIAKGDLPKKCKCKDKIKIKTSNLLVETNIKTDKEDTFLRGETCQGIYVNFKNILDTTRQKIPFGVAQIGKAFRNEISPRRFLFRTREFEQMEMQYFVNPKDAKKAYEEFKEKRMNWLLSLGLKKEDLRFKDHNKMVFYAKDACDIEFNFPSFGWAELEGIHNRGDYDLSVHQKGSKKDLSYEDPNTGEKYIPYVIETSIGIGRLAMALMCSVYEKEKLEDDERKVLRFHKNIAPTTVAILPLSKNEELSPMAQKVFDLVSPKFSCVYDETQSIGKRYRRQDEIGTPYCVTIDFDTLKDDSVTVRERDTMKQERVKINELINYIQNKFNDE